MFIRSRAEKMPELEGILKKQEADYVNEVYNAVEKIRDEYSSKSTTVRKMYLLKIKQGITGLVKNMFNGEVHEPETDHPNPGFTIVLDWNQYVHKGYIDNGAAFYNEFNYCGQDFSGKNIYKFLKDLMHVDGAILVSPMRKIEKIRAMIIPQKSDEMIADKGLDKKEVLDETLGYMEKVDTRHKFAHLGSYYMGGTTVLTLSQETGNIRIYMNGEIIYSTKSGEVPVKQYDLLGAESTPKTVQVSHS